MDLKEIDAEIQRLQQLRVKAEVEERQKMARQNYQEATALIHQMVEIIRRLDEIGYLPERIAKAVTNSEGKVNPGQFLKKPRAPATPHE